MEDARKKKGFSLPAPLIYLCAGLIAFAIYYLTAYRTVTWWDSSEYILAAATLGIPHPPGSLLLVLLGWAFQLIPLGIATAFELNLLAGIIAAITTMLIAVVAGKIIARNQKAVGASIKIVTGTALGLAIPVLGFAFSQTFWTFAVRFTPYILTPLFTVLIVFLLFRWWEEARKPGAWILLAFAALLIGLDFSVHRTNALLLPGILGWVLLRDPKTLAQWKMWVGSAGGLILGLSLNFVMMPIAARNPLLNANDPTTLGRLWDYITVKQAGGGFLFSIFPRNSALWDHQFADWIDAFQHNFMTTDGPLGAVGMLTGVLALFGVVLMIVRDKRLGGAFVLLTALTICSTVLYFNVPENFFRPFDRHYLPTFVLIAIAASYAGGQLMNATADLEGKRRRIVGAVMALVFLASPASQLARNYVAVDGSDQTAARDIASGMLNELAPNAILFTNGDNDTFPLWCMQGAEKVRPDVTVINLPLLQTNWYAASLAARDTALHLSFDQTALRQLQPIPADSSGRVTRIAVTQSAAFFGLPEDTMVFRMPDSLSILMQPTLVESHYLVSDRLLTDIIARNFNSRPIYFAGTVSPTYYQAFDSFLRRDGMSFRLLPVDAVIDAERIRRSLLTAYKYDYFQNYGAPIDDIARNFAQQLVASWTIAADAFLTDGDANQCLATLDKVNDLIPRDRVARPDQLQQMEQQLRQSASAPPPPAPDTLNIQEM